MSRKLYTKNEIVSKLKEIKNVEKIYSSNIVKYKGNTKDTDEKYSEVISQELLNNSSKYNWDNIKQIKREKNYNIEHDGKYNVESPRVEETIAMKMYNNTYSSIGKMLNYQVPLKDKAITEAGKIDLIAYEEKSNVLYLIELKNDKSPETLLRCVLEIATYNKQIDAEKLKSDYNLHKNTSIKPAILIFENTRPAEDLKDKYVNKLIEKFNIEIFIAEKIDESTFNINKK